VRLSEDVRGRALRLADSKLREVTVAYAQEACDAAQLKSLRREQLVESAGEFGGWGGSYWPSFRPPQPRQANPSGHRQSKR